MRNKKIIRTAGTKNILIYGAGEAGKQLAMSLKENSQFKVIGFLDENKLLHKKFLLGKIIYPTSNIKKIVKAKDINFIFLAIPSISRRKRSLIIKKLNRFKVIVKTLPSVSEIIDGKVTISDIKDFNINDLLDRDQVKPNNKLLNQNIKDKTVVVTGAGGSIGSELCRQIMKLKPKKLLLLELNEYALYKIFEELMHNLKSQKIIPILVNVQNQKQLETIFQVFNVNTVYHAAAYKHVPLVEENICPAIENNVFGTLSVIKAIINTNVKNFVLISSDKAVRPTNIMGATKRLAELCVKRLFDENSKKFSNFSIVRFGNVLESSGSVIPKFKKQIYEDGVVTLTHKKVTRYFMTVTEAAQLVIQAGAMGKKSEVFVLDMGKRVKIYNLIKKMIYLSGLKIKDNKNPSGDIQIKIIGLRPGEKLYEELLIGSNPKKTNHPKIKKINDPSISLDRLKKGFEKLKNLIAVNNSKEAKKTLGQLIKSYKSNSKIIDHVYINKFVKFKI
jgi:FlaA1/EpsC-like NDP-sugar epimerase